MSNSDEWGRIMKLLGEAKLLILLMWKAKVIIKSVIKMSHWIFSVIMDIIHGEKKTPDHPKGKDQAQQVETETKRKSHAPTKRRRDP